jgi:ribosome-binding factor A
MGSDYEVEKSKEVLEANRGRLRKEIGSQLGIRITPTIELISDEVPEAADALNDLLAEARRRDEEVLKLAKNAQPAGDADPYLKKSSDG